jgi:SAM-dependent methyltransferase
MTHTPEDFRKEFEGFRANYGDSMERMFAAVSDLYAAYWHDCFHFALFENDDESRETAFRRTHEKYIDAAGVRRAGKILDLGCGRGGFTDLLAANTAGEVLGIDISRSQLAHTARFSRPNLRFRRHDIMKVDALGETFDAVTFVDAECYLPDKESAIGKIARVMNPGGRFLLLAWCKRSGLGGVQEELVLFPFMKYWAIPDLETPEHYRDYLRQSGLRILEMTDLNHLAKRNWEYGYEQALKAVRELSAGDITRYLWKGMTLGAEGIRMIKEQFPAALYIKAGFDAGFLRYVCFLAEK